MKSETFHSDRQGDAAALYQAIADADRRQGRIALRVSYVEICDGKAGPEQTTDLYQDPTPAGKFLLRHGVWADGFATVQHAFDQKSGEMERNIRQVVLEVHPSYISVDGINRIYSG